MKKQNKISSGKTNFAWSSFKDLIGGDSETNLQVTEWPNGEGFDVYISWKTEEKTFKMSWDEWNWLVKTVRQMQKVPMYVDRAWSLNEMGITENECDFIQNKLD